MKITIDLSPDEARELLKDIYRNPDSLKSLYFTSASTYDKKSIMELLINARVLVREMADDTETRRELTIISAGVSGCYYFINCECFNSFNINYKDIYLFIEGKEVKSDKGFILKLIK